MKNKLFGTNVYQYHVTDWETKKEKIKELLNDNNLVRGDTQWFESDRSTNNNAYVDDLVDILADDLRLFLSDIKVANVTIDTAWTVKYHKGDFHPPHTHSSSGYSGVLYLEYDDEEHTPVWFVDHVTNPITDKTNYCVPNVFEGMIVIVPSNILHFTYPNTSDKVRQIIGFDIKFKNES